PGVERQWGLQTGAAGGLRLRLRERLPAAAALAELAAAALAEGEPARGAFFAVLALATEATAGERLALAAGAERGQVDADGSDSLDRLPRTGGWALVRAAAGRVLG